MAGIFSLNRVYKKQVKNINDNNFDMQSDRRECCDGK